MRWRVSVTILLGTAWLVFILLFAAFWSGPPLSLFQDIVIFFASLIVLFFSDLLHRAIGSRGLAALERLMGMILTTMAVQMLLDGIEKFVRGM